MNPAIPIRPPLALPTLADLIPAVENAAKTENTRRAYAGALRRFVTSAPGPLSRATVLSYAAEMRREGYGPVSINQTLTALKRLAEESVHAGLLTRADADSIAQIEGEPRRGTRAGNWLSLDQAQSLLNRPPCDTLSGLRDRAVLALLLGGGLRREEAARLDCAHLQLRDARWCLVDLQGKHNCVRTVPLPLWTLQVLRAWLGAAQVNSGRLLRRLDGSRIGEGLSDRAIWDIVRRWGPGIAPHDLRRTFAKLARSGGANIEQIQIALGHASVVTTERYLGTALDLRNPACDRLGLRP